ncbi:formimidoylglutamate deiminase [Longispora fulva]|uniref:Formiminoglutamate deiminase n=1 Tax=Longispora fulva TaxID=619741 RepID=A0A8J7KTQ0_9ACTN|nr:formimidoylglutamate deiminase [Longispora fulva]MBG6140982.1 formiminoglutamate deiminase [Longispora fulva]GIG60751.1 formimidoylglutamate deiminase [Longispora fulva]
MQVYWCEHAWLPDGPADGVLIVVDDGRIASVMVDQPPQGERLAGLTLPGFANAHSHAFHRALRGRTKGDSFWSWREGMYALADRLTPDSYLRLARATYAEMALAGVTSVGEFHYLHHGPGGKPYADPNAMGEALIQAARDAGVRLTLLDTCYLAGGIGVAPNETQRRFSDGNAAAWQDRVRLLKADGNTVIGAAIHSVRAVPRDQLSAVDTGGPLHVHLSEQPAENEQCLAAYGVTPTALLHAAGVLGPRTSAVHATHLTAADVGLLGATRTTACFCPTTEADLADGIGPARELADAGSPLSLGSDQHALIDPLEEARRLEHHDRLRTGQRGRFTGAELVTALTNHASLGWEHVGVLAPGAAADLVTIRTDTVRTAGAAPAQLLLAASAADISRVVVGGSTVVRDGEHVSLGNVGHLLRDAIAEAFGE